MARMCLCFTLTARRKAWLEVEHEAPSQGVLKAMHSEGSASEFVPAPMYEPYRPVLSQICAF